MAAGSAVHHHGSYLCRIPSFLPETFADLAEDKDRPVSSNGSGLDVSHHMPLISIGTLIETQHRRLLYRPNSPVRCRQVARCHLGYRR